jgi:hypothetical protein
MLKGEDRDEIQEVTYLLKCYVTEVGHTGRGFRTTTKSHIARMKHNMHVTVHTFCVVIVNAENKIITN